jgi:hypothetical protein|nr:MAG TPA: hypothetical protein [Caudoviricetes sp.]DAW56970.1 MAG TPA: hypothetical protein [Caudoviricetes sp.]DAX84178.1 MAG TPA: hypothetical protein [Caudoviricetes sp.]DAX98487.1 MAG TPA: hypothetical protein [Caudoviricetes sp.]
MLDNLKKVVQIETTEGMLANDINEFVQDSNIDEIGLDAANEKVLEVKILDSIHENKKVLLIFVGNK